MKTTGVRELMVPLEDYVTVSKEATLFEAVTALEKGRDEIDRTRYQDLHRALLVSDKNNRIVGKISMLDMLKALEPKYAELGDPGRLSRAGFSVQFLQSMLEHASLWNKPIKDLCSEAADYKVKNFVHMPTEGEYIEESAGLDEAIHLLVMGHHQSLLVTRGKDIVGILRMCDVFVEISKVMKTCKL
jgi:CBS domain-containing protein